MEKTRDPIWDIAKGIGVLLVIAGHMPQLMPNVIHEWINSFHMPLFFFISGYFAKIYESKPELKKKIFRVIKRIAVPYYTYSIIFGLLFGIYHSDVNYTFNLVKSTLLGYGSYYPLWFLFSLALMEIVFSVSSYFLKDKEWMFAIACVLIGFYFCHHEINVFKIGTTFYGFGFYYVGFIFSQKKMLRRVNRVKYILLAAFTNAGGGYCYCF